jgi:hypothetical protein
MQLRFLAEFVWKRKFPQINLFLKVSGVLGTGSKRYRRWKKRLVETGSLERKPPKERSGQI